MRILIVTTKAWHLPTIIIDQVVCDLLSATNLPPDTEMVIVSDGFVGEIPNGASIINTEEAALQLQDNTQLSIVHFGEILKGSEHFPSFFINLYQPKHLADGILSNWLAQWKYNKIINKAKRVFTWKDLPPSRLASFEWADLALARSRNTGGTNYFMAFVELSEMVPTLKEFSIFKRWQQTSMAIVFICKNQHELTRALPLVKGYKYRNAVFFTLLDDVKIIDLAAAYCTIWSTHTQYYTKLMQWSAGLSVPLLINSKTPWPLAFTKAGDCFDFSESMGLSNHFKLYYKDELYKQSKANHAHAWLNQMMADSNSKNESILDSCLP